MMSAHSLLEAGLRAIKASCPPSVFRSDGDGSSEAAAAFADFSHSCAAHVVVRSLLCAAPFVVPNSNILDRMGGSVNTDLAGWARSTFYKQWYLQLGFSPSAKLLCLVRT